MCQRLLLEKNLHALIEWLDSNDMGQLKDFVYALLALNEMKHYCFSLELLPGWQFKLQMFVMAYEKLNIARTPKFHIIREHVVPFCEKTGRGLGFFSEVCTNLYYFFSKQYTIR